MRINIRNPEARKPKFALRIGKETAEPASLGVPWSLWSEPFRTLVQDALDASRKVDAMQRPGAEKLSCEAFLRQTLAISPAASVKRVLELRRKLESGDIGLDNAKSALRKMLKKLKEPNVRTPPTAARWEERSRAMFLQPRVTEVLAELTAVNATTLELFGVAILIAGETAGVFGTSDGTQADIDADIAAAIKRRDEMFAQIGTAWTAPDIDPGKYQFGATSAATFKGTNVPIAPADTAGKRLVDSLDSGARLVDAIKKNQRVKK